MGAPYPPDRLIPFRFAEGPGNAHLDWACGVEFRLPETLLHRLGLLSRIERGGDLKIEEAFAAPGIGSAEIESLRFRAAFTDRKPLSTRLPVSYQRIPPAWRDLIARCMGRWRRKSADRWAKFPGWPLDLSVDFLEDLTAGKRHSVFAEGPAPVLLTHDIDSPEGLRNLVKDFLKIEEEAGARSVNFIVPCAWPIDPKLLGEVRERGHAVGAHGYDHANRTAFASAEERGKRLGEAKSRLAPFEAQGYRAPSLLRTRPLLEDLSKHFLYDSSIPTSGGLFPVSNNGCAGARPFRIGGLVEIPLSLPRDGSLRFLGHSPVEIKALWMDCARRIAQSGGVVVLLTHCEARFSGNPAMLEAYRGFIDFLKVAPEFAWSTPRAVMERMS